MKHALVVFLVLIVAGMTVFFIQSGITADTVTTTVPQGQVRVYVNNDLGITLAKGAFVRLVPATGENATLLTKRTADGYFTARVPVGTYEVEAQADSHLSDSRPVLVQENKVTSVIFDLAPEI